MLAWLMFPQFNEHDTGNISGAFANDCMTRGSHYQHERILPPFQNAISNLEIHQLLGQSTMLT